MNRYTVLGLAVGLFVGIFIGYQAGSTAAPGPSAPGSAAAPQMPPPVAGDTFQARIAQHQAIVSRDPKNVGAWIQLGNDYFDTRQPRKAIEAYGRALELQPDNPNVLTDQGVMYRDVGEFQQAIANFEKASRIDPKHPQSVFNMAVVYANDLGDPKKAAEAWRKVIQIAPQSPQAEQARQALAALERQPGAAR